MSENFNKIGQEIRKLQLFKLWYSPEGNSKISNKLWIFFFHFFCDED